MSEARRWLEHITQNNYQIAFDKAAADLVEAAADLVEADDDLVEADAASIAGRAGASMDGREVSIRYFGTEYRITLPACSFDPDSLALGEKILVLHYLVGQSGSSGAAEEFVSFSSLPGGMFYMKPFRNRSVNRIVGAFGSNAAGLVKAGAALGGRPGELGDASVIVEAFPRLSVMAVVHEGDDELPPDGDILFTGDCTRFLCLEDLAVLAGLFAGKLTKAAAP